MDECGGLALDRLYHHKSEGGRPLFKASGGSPVSPRLVSQTSDAFSLKPAKPAIDGSLPDTCELCDVGDFLVESSKFPSEGR